MPEEKQQTNMEGHNAEPQHETEDTKADVKPEPVAASENVEVENPSGSEEEESEEESEAESDSEGYTTGSESSGSHTDHSASDKEVC